MSTKKKPQSTGKPEDKPKYKAGDKLYFIDRTNSKPRIFYGEVDAASSETVPLRNVVTHKIEGTTTRHSYQLVTSAGTFDVDEYRLHTSFANVAEEFAKEYFVSLIK